MKRLLLSILVTFFAVFPLSLRGQSLSGNAEISLLTCGSANELYSLFGHSAIRVHDPIQRIDVVFNYGTFNYRTPHFMPKFVRGTLKYYLDDQDFQRFMWSYQQEKRWVVEQQLDITLEQKNQIFQAIMENLKEENKYYQYDFFYDNCSTRIRDILKDAVGPSLVFGENKNDSTYRQLITPYITYHPWTAIGIQLILGSGADLEADKGGHMFLPNKLMESFDEATIDGKPLVKRKESLYKPKASPMKTATSIRPDFILYVVLAIVLVLMVQFDKKRKILPKLDALLFLPPMLLGLLFTFMWFGTDHEVTHANANLFWTSPLYLVLLIGMAIKKGDARTMTYIRYVLVIGGGVMMLLSFTGIQVLPTLAYPYIIVLIIRHIDVLRRAKNLPTSPTS